jgi:hypothetical protein
MSGRSGLVCLSVAVTLLAVTLAAPVVRAPNERIFGTEIVGRHHDPYTVMQQLAGAPVPAPYLQPATDWLGRALAGLMSPVAAFNILVLWTFPLTAAFTYLLAHAITRSVPAAAVAGLLSAFAPFHVAHAAYHPHVAQVQWIPLYVASVGTGGGAPGAVQAAKEMLLLSSVTAAFRASARPTRLAPFFMAMAVSARMLPTNVVLVSMVAELLTSHCTLHSLAPLMTLTVELGEVMSVLDIWKVQDAAGSPWASSVSVPVRLDAAAVTQ